MPGIIVGIDGSAHSRRALEWAAREAALRRVPLTVLTVQETSVGYWGGGHVTRGDREATEHAREIAQVEADKVLDELGDARPESVTVRSVSGGPARQLLAAARDADMIVVGSRGAGGFARLLMGSVSTQVSHHARCPVAIIPLDRTSP
jgi:nucleotide-binding universal stress UspA family protein